MLIVINTVKISFFFLRRPLPSLQTQRDARQATFLFHRGLKVHEVLTSVAFGTLGVKMPKDLYHSFVSLIFFQIQAQVQKPTLAVRTGQ